MSVDFRVSDFFYPVSLLKLHSFFQKSQWFSPERLREYQEERLRLMIRHASVHVPYYRTLLAERGIDAEDIRTLQDLRRLPVLSKELLRSRTNDFQADNRAAFRPIPMHTSGTSGRRLDFLLDRKTNILEFVYYWRYWGWGGYRLGDPFAEFSTTFFLKQENAGRGLSFEQLGTGRLLLNSLYLSAESAVALAARIERHRARFLKTLPSVGYAFVRLLKARGVAAPGLKAVFTTGEILFPHQRKAIESAFGCKVFDSYGHMERVIAASECEQGKLHVNSDYGLLELGEPVLERSPAGLKRAPILGTSLHNFSMPLIRYDTGDMAEFDDRGPRCSCGRGFPVLDRVEGRQEDTIVTPDGRVVSTLFLVCDELPGIRVEQIVQEKPDLLVVKAAKKQDYTNDSEVDLKRMLRTFVGSLIKIEVELIDDATILLSKTGKFKVVRSNIRQELD